MRQFDLCTCIFEVGPKDLFPTRSSVERLLRIEVIVLMQTDGIESTANLLKAMSHPVRLLIMHRLTQGACRVEELQRLLVLDQATISTHLARLRFERIIVGNKNGKTVHYELTDTNTKYLVEIIAETFFEKSFQMNQTEVAETKLDGPKVSKSAVK
ncbi:MAG: metalloregulator ArsR/SmtB family transcription factor [Rhizobiaceae bacterium]